jgi:peptide/nickel transport system permease protein
MKKYLFKRILTGFGIVLFVILLNYVIIRLAPGDPARIMAGLDNPSEELIATLTQKYGLDQPLYIQFWRYITTLFRGDMGTSYMYNQAVSSLIFERLGASLLLSGVSAVLAVILGSLMGLHAGRHHGHAVDHVFSGTAYAFNAMPSFWLGIMLILIFASTFKLLPTQGMYNLRKGYTGWAYVVDVMQHMVLPCATLVAVQIPTYFRITKSSVMQVMSEDFVTTFRVTGMSERKIFNKYVLKNALLPIVTVFGINLAYVVSGSMLIEIVFSWPGIGVLMYRAITMRDYNLLMGIYLLISVSVVVMMIIVDLVYAWLDPRIRYD